LKIRLSHYVLKSLVQETSFHTLANKLFCHRLQAEAAARKQHFTMKRKNIQPTPIPHHCQCFGGGGVIFLTTLDTPASHHPGKGTWIAGVQNC